MSTDPSNLHEDSVSPDSGKQEMFRTFFDLSYEAVCIHDQGILLDANGRFFEMFGYARRELIGKQLIPLLFTNKSAQAIRQRLETGNTSSECFECRRKDGAIIYVQNRTAKIEYQGKPARLVAIREITEKVLQEQKLRESEERYRQFSDLSFEGIFIHDQGILLEANDRSLEMFGYPRAELINSQTFKKSMPAASLETIKKHALSTKPAFYKVIAQKKDGTLFPAEVRSTPILYKGKQVRAAVIRDISKQEKTIEKLRESEEKYRQVINNAGQVIVIHDLKGAFLFANSFTEQVLDTPLDTLLTKNLSDFFSPETTSMLLDTFRQAVEAQQTKHVTAPLRMKGGCRWFEASNIPLKNPEGKYDRVLVIANDIHEQKLLEDRLRESEEKYRAVVESAQEAIAISDRDGTYLFINTMGAIRLGGEPEEIVGKNMRTFFPQQVAENQIDVVQRVIEAETEVTVESLTFVQEQARWYQTTVCPIRNAEGNVQSALIVARDIHERKAMEQALRQSEEKYRSLVENAGESIVLVDTQGVIQFVNTEGARRVNVTPEQIIGKSIQDVFSPEVADDCLDLIREVSISKIPRTEILQMGKEQLFWRMLTLVPLFDPENNVESLLAVVKDIDEYVKIQQQLKEYRQKMASTERLASIGAVSASLAHELNQPITVIQLLIQNLRDRWNEMHAHEDPDAPDSFQQILLEVEKTSGILNEYRSLSRPSSKQATSGWNLDHTLNLLTKVLHESAELKKLKINIDPNISTLPTLFYPGDLEQVFFILIQNSIQAAKENTDNQVNISAVLNENILETVLTDTCQGIPREHLKKIFDPFFSTKDRDQATGLGLTIVRQILDQAGGQVAVFSTPGEGTTFQLCLPVTVHNHGDHEGEKS